MPTDRQLDDRISRWLEADAPTQLPDRVLRATFERTRQTRQQGGWQHVLGRLQMNRMILGLGGAAVVVLAAVLALGLYFNNPGVGSPPSPSPTTEPSPNPTATLEPSPTPDAGIDVGEFVLHDGRYFDQVIRVTIPAPGWSGAQGGGILVKNENHDTPDGAAMIVFGGDELFVYRDPCQWRTTRPDAPAATVDELVTALVAQASRDASTPVDITVDGYVGKSITLHVPDDAVFRECDRGEFRTLVHNPVGDEARYHQDPGQIDQLWIVDVNGTPVVIDAAYYDGTPADHIAEMRAIVESMMFDD